MKYLNIHRKILRGIADPIAKALAYTAVTPNQVTFFRLFLAIGVSYLFSLSCYRWNFIGVIVLFFLLVLDFVDGSLAKRKSIAGAIGSFWDSMIDRISLPILVFGIIWGMANKTGNSNVWILGFIFISILLLIEILHIYEVFLLNIRRKESLSDSAEIVADTLYFYAWVPHVCIMCFFGVMNKFGWYLIVTLIYVTFYLVFSMIKLLLTLQRKGPSNETAHSKL